MDLDRTLLFYHFKELPVNYYRNIYFIYSKVFLLKIIKWQDICTSVTAHLHFSALISLRVSMKNVSLGSKHKKLRLLQHV